MGVGSGAASWLQHHSRVGGVGRGEGVVDKMISNVLCDLPFNQNHPLKSADEWCIRIGKSKINLED